MKPRAKTTTCRRGISLRPRHRRLPLVGFRSLAPETNGSGRILSMQGNGAEAPIACMADASGRKRVNINGAVGIDTMETVTDFSLCCFNRAINGESSLRLFRKIEAKHPDAEVIHVIVDNASYYVSKWSKGKLEGTKTMLHYLPGYSPNLNLIERLWKFFKKKILYNQYYEKFEDFLTACKGFFRCRTRYREELRSLLTENFHRYQSN